MTGARQSSDSAALSVWREARRSGLYFAGLLIVLGGLYALFVSSMPSMSPSERMILTTFPPRSLADLVAQRDVLLLYASTHPRLVLVGLCAGYVLMQTFAVPGTLALSVLSGALYGPRLGWLLVAAVSTAGALSCYCLSAVLGAQLVRAAWPEKMEKYAAAVAARRSELLSYVIFLRVTPLLPNTFINLASPVVGVPPLPFVLGTLLGCAPANYIAVNAGSHLSDLHSLADLYDRRILGTGVAVGLLALAPTLLKSRHARTERLQADMARKAR